jgi:predicted Na+-dependent transporter
LADKKYTDEMVGEALREAGTLVMVFAPLYVIFEGSKASWITLVLVLLVGIAFLTMGIQVERRRQ